MSTSAAVLRALSVFSVLALAACADAPETDVGGKVSLNTCQRFDGTVEVLFAGEPGFCSNCFASNPQNAVDGDLNTFATLDIGALVDGSRSLRANAQPGVVYPAGSVAVIGEIRKTASAQVEGTGVLRSYLAGTLQDEQVIQDSGVVSVNGASGTGLSAFAFNTLQPFDSLEFGVAGSFSSNVTLVVYEFCSAIN